MRSREKEPLERRVDLKLRKGQLVIPRGILFKQM
jgi:hypothetical protein